MKKKEIVVGKEKVIVPENTKELKIKQITVYGIPESVCINTKLAEEIQYANIKNPSGFLQLTNKHPYVFGKPKKIKITQDFDLYFSGLLMEHKNIFYQGKWIKKALSEDDFWMTYNLLADHYQNLFIALGYVEAVLNIMEKQGVKTKRKRLKE